MSPSSGAPGAEPDLATAARLQELSGALAEWGQTEDALAYLQRAAATYAGSSELRAAQCYRGCAELAVVIGHLDEADRLLGAAGTAYRAAGLPEEQASCELRRGEVLRAHGRTSDAQARFEAAWTAHESDNSLLGAAYSALGVASILHGRGQLDAALYVVERATGMLASAEPRDQYVGQAESRAGALAGLILVDSGRPAEAHLRLTDARAWFQVHGEGVDAARVDMSLAEIARSAGQFDAALETLAGARAEFESAGLTAEAAVSRVRTATVLMDIGRMGEAVDILEEAVAALRGAGWTVACATAELSLGIARLKLGNTRAAREHIEWAREVFLDAGMSVEVARAESYVAVCRAQMDEARDSK